MPTVPHKYFLACSTGKCDVVAAFLDGGVDPNSRDQYKLTGLMWAGRKGRVEVADLLLDRGATLEAVDARGRTALFHAAVYKRCDFVAFLAKHGANVSPVDMHECTPLDLARTNRHTEMVALLERFGAVGKYSQSEQGSASATEISIGQQSGGPDDGLMWPKVHLYMMLAKHCTRTYCPAIDQFSLVLRVSGKFDDFGPEAIEHIRRRRQERYITADIVVPVRRWKGKTEKELKKYLAAQVRTGLERLVARLKKDREDVDDVALFADVDTGIAEFLRTRTPHRAWE
jgi:Ankyrin repeats (3 copies)